MKTAKYWITKLNLEKHPEGGWFKEVYRSVEMISAKCLSGIFNGDRNISTSIYYLLEGDDFSAFHRIKSDEIWHYYAGNSSIEIITIRNGEIEIQQLGNQSEEGHVFQFVVPAETWFAARVGNKKGFALVGCTVSPGFHFDDFELAGKNLIDEFPLLENQIRSLIRI
ncbi:MAG TPA: cupin domain-containing protein [Draconibacterium sp.]|nr:cupin domain-containing protein [Draconibacterium sp.]HRX12323.1 cupin domain-containing protein [Draconibacterium sp.]